MHSLCILPTSGVRQAWRDTTCQWQEGRETQGETGQGGTGRARQVKWGRRRPEGRWQVQQCQTAEAANWNPTKYLKVLKEATFHLEPESKPGSPKLWVQVCGKSSTGKDWLAVVPSKTVYFWDGTQPQNSSSNSRCVLNANLALCVRKHFLLAVWSFPVSLKMNSDESKTLGW